MHLHPRLAKLEPNYNVLSPWGPYGACPAFKMECILNLFLSRLKHTSKDPICCVYPLERSQWGEGGGGGELKEPSLWPCFIGKWKNHCAQPSTIHARGGRL